MAMKKLEIKNKLAQEVHSKTEVGEDLKNVELHGGRDHHCLHVPIDHIKLRLIETLATIKNGTSRVLFDILVPPGDRISRFECVRSRPCPQNTRQKRTMLARTGREASNAGCRASTTLPTASSGQRKDQITVTKGKDTSDAKSSSVDPLTGKNDTHPWNPQKTTTENMERRQDTGINLVDPSHDYASDLSSTKSTTRDQMVEDIQRMNHIISQQNAEIAEKSVKIAILDQNQQQNAEMLRSLQMEHDKMNNQISSLIKSTERNDGAQDQRTTHQALLEQMSETFRELEGQIAQLSQIVTVCHGQQFQMLEKLESKLDTYHATTVGMLTELAQQNEAIAIKNAARF